MGKPETIKIGTRGSQLALYQANLVKRLLEEHHGQECAVEIVPVTTTGDKVTHCRLSDLGGKGLFTKEIDQVLLDGEIDIAVHSMKDVETWTQKEFVFAAILEREDPRDALVSLNELSKLKSGSVVGTCSLRRTTQLLNARPDLAVEVLRGNVPTRIDKVKEGQLDAAVLACAGLKRLGLESDIKQIFSVTEMTPSAAQGAIGIVCLDKNIKAQELIAPLNHDASAKAVHLERFFLEGIDGHCGTPVGALVTLEDQIDLVACVGTEDGKDLWRESLSFSFDHAEHEIEKLAKEMKKWLAAHNL